MNTKNFLIAFLVLVNPISLAQHNEVHNHNPIENTSLGHIFEEMPVDAQKHLIDFALHVCEEATGEDNYLSNYPQYLALRAQSERFAKNYYLLPSNTHIFYREALKNMSQTIFKSLHVAASHYEHEVTKHMKFDPE